MSQLLDTHLHVWDTTQRQHPWLAGTGLPAVTGLPADPGRSYLLVEADAADAWAEAQWLDQVATDPRVHGIVPSLRLDSTHTAADLRRLGQLPSVVGVRLLLQDSGRFADPELVQGLRTVAEQGLPFDACVRAAELPALCTLLRQLPELTVVLDHLGKPPLADPAAMARWRDDLAALAELPTVHCKLSGLPAETPDRELLSRLRGPVIDRAVSVFGAERCVVGSDHPVSEGADDWCAWVLTRIEPAARELVGHRNAASIYRRSS